MGVPVNGAEDFHVLTSEVTCWYFHWVSHPHSSGGTETLLLHGRNVKIPIFVSFRIGLFACIPYDENVSQGLHTLTHGSHSQAREQSWPGVRDIKG